MLTRARMTREISDDGTRERAVWVCPLVDVGRAVAAWVQEHGAADGFIDAAIVAGGGPDARAAESFDERDGAVIIAFEWVPRT